MNQYLEMKERHQKEVDNFPMAFAFNQKQFEEGMKKLGLLPDQTDMVYKLGGGGFYRRSDAKKLKDMFVSHEKEIEEAIKSDTTGEGYIFQMFYYELNNHEYGYTCETEDTLDALGLTLEEISKSESLSNGFELAKKRAMEDSF